MNNLQSFVKHKINNDAVLLYSYAGYGSVILPAGVTIEKVEAKSALSMDDLNRLNSKIIKIDDKFSYSTLWLLRDGGIIAGYEWTVSVKSATKRFHYPMTPGDCVLYGAYTWPEYRGHGYYGLLVNHIICELSNGGTRRFYTEVAEWNTASLNGLSRTPFKPFGIAKKYVPWNRLRAI